MKRVQYDSYSCPVEGCATVCTSPGQLGGHVAAHKKGTVRTQAMPQALEPLTWYCACGAALTLRGETDPQVSEAISRAWRSHHDADENCEPVSPDECRTARYYRTKQRVA